MTCREFENLLGKPLSAEAQAHLQSCESCKAIAQWFDADSATSVPVPTIALRDDLKPVLPLPSHWWIAAAIFALGGIIVAVGGRHLGIAGWDALDTTQKITIFSGLCIVGATAALLLARQMFPTLAKRVSPAVCIAAALCAIIAGPVALMPWEYDADGFVETGMSCAQYGLMYSAAAIVLTWLAVRRGYFLRPGWSGALAGLISGSIALVVLEAYCPLIERSHVLAWHGSVVAVSVIVSSIFAYLASKRRA
jgi:hypothetical protein